MKLFIELLAIAVLTLICTAILFGQNHQSPKLDNCKATYYLDLEPERIEL